MRFNQSSQTGKVWTRYTTQVAPVVSGITAYTTDPVGFGEVWISSNTGIDRFYQTDVDAGTWTHFDPATTASLPTNNIVSAFTNPIDGHLWFGGGIGGAVEAHYNDISLIWDRYESPNEQYEVNAIAFDLNSTVWFGKAVGASSINLASNTWTYYTRDSTDGRFPGGAVHAVVTNYHTTRWFGTDSGLVILDDTTYTKLTEENSELPGNRISDLALDLRGNLWIGTSAGLAVYRNGGIRF
jgi:ligand-binding sensor domain-containing protein